nr:hypothetical protein [Tanacetum cinerariifolium]
NVVKGIAKVSLVGFWGVIQVWSVAMMGKTMNSSGVLFIGGKTLLAWIFIVFTCSGTIAVCMSWNNFPPIHAACLEKLSS